MSAMRAWVDRNMDKVVSKKLFAWATATVLLCVDKVEPSDWLQITIAYVGSQAAVDLITKFKGK